MQMPMQTWHYLFNDALAPTKDNDTLKNLLSGLAYMITKITGKDDWKAAPVISIAAILSSLSDNVAVNWDGNKFTVPALGVSGLMAQNGYVNFGKLVGGLIIQWGFDNQNDSTNNIESYSITIPLSTSQVFSYATGSSGNDLTNILKISGNTMIVRTFRSLQTDENNFVKTSISLYYCLQIAIQFKLYGLPSTGAYQVHVTIALAD